MTHNELKQVDTIAVSTADTREAILAANNSAAWTLNVAKWGNQLKWLVCMRKEGTQRRPFLLCRVSNITLRADPNDPRPRYAIEFDQFADLPPRTPLVEGTQYPVRLDTLKAFHIDADELELRPAPPKTLDYSYSPRIGAEPETGVSIAEAKRRLAIGLGVREEQIDITIRA